MAEKTTTSIRLDPALKSEATAVFAKMGLNLSSGISVYLRAVVGEKKVPFEVRAYETPSDKTKPSGKTRPKKRESK